MNKDEDGGKKDDSGIKKPRRDAGDNSNVNPIFGPIAQTTKNALLYSFGPYAAGKAVGKIINTVKQNESPISRIAVPIKRRAINSNKSGK